MRISDWSSDVCSSDLCSNGATSVSGTFTNPVGAFGFFSEPDPFSVHSFTLSLSDGSSISGDFSGNAGAGFLGWVGDNITGFTISSDVSFVFGDFYTAVRAIPEPDRQCVVSGKSVSVRVDLGGRRIIKHYKKHTHQHTH